MYGGPLEVIINNHMYLDKFIAANAEPLQSVLRFAVVSGFKPGHRCLL